MQTKKNSILLFIIFISTVYGLIVYSGFLGFGPDYVAAYHKSNVIASQFYNYIGWYLSTLAIFNIKFGIFFVPFIISFANGYLLKFFFKKQNLNSVFLFFIILTLSLVSWPLSISSNNAMRQGLAMSFIFLSILFFEDKKFFLGNMLMLITAFTHKSGIAFVLIVLSIFFFKIFIKQKLVNKRLNYLIFGLVLFLIFFIINNNITVYYGRYDSNKAIGIDFTLLNLAINITYIVFFSIYFKHLKSFVLLFLYLFSFTAIALYFSGLYWEYERFNMMMMPGLIYSFSIFFKLNSKYVYLLFVMTILFILTLLTGMYDYGVGVYTWEQIK